MAPCHSDRSPRLYKFPPFSFTLGGSSSPPKCPPQKCPYHIHTLNTQLYIQGIRLHFPSWNISAPPTFQPSGTCSPRVSTGVCSPLGWGSWSLVHPLTLTVAVSPQLSLISFSKASVRHLTVSITTVFPPVMSTDSKQYFEGKNNNLVVIWVS